MSQKNVHDILIRPLFTEKNLMVKERHHTLVFEVAQSANSIEIKEAVEKIFSTQVEKVNITKRPRKPKRQGRNSGFSKGYRKAYVKLREGAPIPEVFEGY